MPDVSLLADVILPRRSALCMCAHRGWSHAEIFKWVQMPDLSAPAWPADRLVFVNDVFFCAGDLMRLLQHGDADVACGMDFMAWKDPPSSNDIQPYGPSGPPLSVCSLHAICADMQ